MPVKVSMMKPGGLGTINQVGIGDCRAAETVSSFPGTTTIAAADGEIAYIASTEAAAVILAHGTTPDAAATAKTAATSAGYALQPGQYLAVALKVGDKINVKTFA